jgi:hypothetical protein
MCYPKQKGLSELRLCPRFGYFSSYLSNCIKSKPLGILNMTFFLRARFYTDCNFHEAENATTSTKTLFT